MSSRDELRAIAQQNLQIFEDGLYQTSDGTVEWVAEALERSVGGTIRVASPPAPQKRSGMWATRITVADDDTLSGAARLLKDGADDVCLLNFASARSPGGGFLRGGNAQEEALCRATTLYQALAAQGTFYQQNQDWPDALYADALLYTPDVLIIRDGYGFLQADPPCISVITAPAPNRTALADANARRALARVDAVLERRIAMILDTADRFNRRNLVLGAWGCGVFGNDPAHVAAVFAAALEGPFSGVFDRAHFAVPTFGDDRNFTAFQSALDRPAP